MQYTCYVNVLTCPWRHRYPCSSSVAKRLMQKLELDRFFRTKRPSKETTFQHWTCEQLLVDKLSLLFLNSVTIGEFIVVMAYVYRLGYYIATQWKWVTAMYMNTIICTLQLYWFNYWWVHVVYISYCNIVCNYEGGNSSTKFIIAGVARVLHSVKKMSTLMVDKMEHWLSMVCCYIVSTTGMLLYTFVWIVPPW